MDGAHDRDVLSLGDVLEEGHHAHRGRGIDAGRGLVQEQNLRPFDQRERDGEAPLVARGQAADDLAARARVLELLEPDGVEELVHLGGALGDVEVSAVQRHGVLEVFPGGEGCPEGVELLDVGADSVVHGGGEGFAVDADVAGGRAAGLLQRQRIQERGLARAGRAEDGQHVTGGDVAVDVLQERLGQAAPLDVDGVVQALEREPHLLAAIPGGHGDRSTRGSCEMDRKFVKRWVVDL